MKNLIINLLISASLAISAISASGVDITINDGQTKRKRYATDPRPGIDESGTTSFNTISNHDWDLKMWAYDDKTQILSYVGGFDIRYGYDGYVIGDIFFDTKQGVNDVPRPSNSNGYFNYTNPGFEYAIAFTGFSGNNLTYNVYQLSSNSQVTTSFFKANHESDPYKLVIDNTLTLVDWGVAPVNYVPDALANISFNTNIGTNSASYGLNSLAQFNVSFLNNRNFDVYLTQSCGNDLLVGSYSVPEVAGLHGGAIVLGLCVAYVYKRRRTE